MPLTFELQEIPNIFMFPMRFFDVIKVDSWAQTFFFFFQKTVIFFSFLMLYPYEEIFGDLTRSAFCFHFLSSAPITWMMNT